MKAKLPFGMSLRLAHAGKSHHEGFDCLPLCVLVCPLLRFLLRDICNDQVDFLTRSFLTLAEGPYSGILFSHFDNYAQSWLFPTERIDYIEQETGLGLCVLFSERGGLRLSFFMPSMKLNLRSA